MATVTYIREKKQHLSAMRGVMRYCMNPAKTWDEQSRQYLVSGINCNGSNAILEFETTKAAHGKMTGTNFYQYVQSFSPEEQITHRQAHEAAKEFAARAWPDSEVLVTTHCDARHIHSHFVINSVSFKTGLKLRQNPNTLNELRQLSDQICQAHGFSVLPQKSKNQSNGMNVREYRSAVRGESWKFRLMNTIDECMKYASDREEFISLMESEGYAVRWERGRKYITYTTPEGMRCRDSKLHEEKYLKGAMEYEFRIRAAEITAGVEADEPTEYGTIDFADCTHHAHCDPVSDGGRSAGADTAGERCLPGAANPAGVSSESEISHRPDGGTKFTDRDSKDPDKVDFTFRTGWERERKAYLQMAELAAGLRPLACGQVGHAGAGSDRGGAGDGVRNRNSRQQYQKSLSLMPLQIGADLMLALCALADDPTDDPEEIQRRIAARNDGEILGFTLGVMVSFVIVLNAIMEKKLQQEAQRNIRQEAQEEQQEIMQQEESQQTMGGL